MKKFLKIVVLFFIILTNLKLIILGDSAEKLIISNKKEIRSTLNLNASQKKINQYDLYINGNIFKSFNLLDEAIDYGNKFEYALIKEKGKTNYLWDNYPPFVVYLNETDFVEFYKFKEAHNFAKENNDSYIYYRKDNNIIWSEKNILKGSHFIQNVSLVLQNPELPRGCEIATLNMLLNYKGIDVDKMTLANEIKKDPTEFSIVNGQTFFGNPHFGFVGDIYNIKKNGLGVYHEPIFELLAKYLPYSSLDITGTNFDALLSFIENDNPVWIITNNTYNILPENKFEKWLTNQGEIKITYQEHSVLITGYDENYIYFNDPWGINYFAKKEPFIKAWEQMGSQAITVSY